MDIYESLLSPSFVINEQLARQIFEILPENGPIIAIIDREGNIWPNDSEEFARLGMSQSFLGELCARIDDGAEPVMTSVNDCSVIGIQLVTDKHNCGYIIIGLPKYSPESTLINIDLVEIVLNQFGLIARLIEKNNFLYEVQMKQYQSCNQDTVTVN